MAKVSRRVAVLQYATVTLKSNIRVRCPDIESKSSESSDDFKTHRRYYLSLADHLAQINLEVLAGRFI